MTKEAALHNFWQGFGWDVYEENTVPTGEDAPNFPYITYQVITDSFGRDVALTASLWTRSMAWITLNEKTREISEAIGRGGVILSCDNGKIWIKRGSPFAQNMGDETDDRIRRKYLNVTAEFMTAD